MGVLMVLAGFRADLTASGRYALVIGAVVPDGEAVGRLKEELGAAALDFASGAAGRLTALPIAEMMGPEREG